MNKFAMAAVVLAAGAGIASADVIPVSMVQVGRMGQTVVSRSARAYSGTFVAGIVYSSSNAGGSGGVWSGVDVDFVALSDKPVWGAAGATVYYPLAGPGTYVQQGSVRPGYAPTASHPGRLFGLDTAGDIRHGVATLNRMDARYPPVAIGNLIDQSSGWVTLGDGGRLMADLGVVSGTYYVFLGEAATSGEPATFALVTGGEIPEPATISALSLGGLLTIVRRRRRR